jgi:hypothetical protein
LPTLGRDRGPECRRPNTGSSHTTGWSCAERVFHHLLPRRPELVTLTIHIHVPDPVRAVLRAVIRSSANRPVAAQKAAEELRLGLWSSVLAEIRWALTPPRAWLSGVAVNLFLSLAWLVVQPVHHEAHRDWVVLIGTYFSSFILADVTTTNLLGVDNVRVEKSLHDRNPLWRLLLVKNLALVVIVGVPTLVFAMALTLWLETPRRLAVTIPDVAVPILSWLGVGNFISVVFAVGYEPLIRRWRQRRQLRRTSRWLIHLALPYALFYLADPVYGLPQVLFWRHVPAALGPALGPDAGRSIIHIGFALIVWLVGTAAAHVLVFARGLHID